jgi:poly-beta-1,6-N-acetyl-D-glucosamine synthase
MSILELQLAKSRQYDPRRMKVCVVLPAKNEGKVISRTLTSLLCAKVRAEDIYVIDDGSSDDTGAKAKSFGCNVLRNEVNIGKAKGVERVTKECDLLNRYDVIAMMDADTTVNPDYYNAVRESFSDPEVNVVCGRPKSAPYNHLTAWRAIGYFMTHFIYRGGQSNMGVINVAPGCASSYRTHVFKALEWSKDTLVEDMDVTIQIHRKELGKIVYQPEANVTTQDPRTLRDYYKQMDRWHSGTWQVSRKHRMIKGTQRVDWEFKLLMGEGLLLSMFILFFPIGLCIWPGLFLRGAAIDAAILFAVAVTCGIVDRRMDVIYYFPAYEFMRFVDALVFFRSFWKITVRRREAHSWFSVQRY